MTEYFKALSQDEYGKLKDAIAQITVLIAGADGDIDHKEMEWAEKVTKIRSYKLPEGLKEYYQDVGEDFHERLESIIETSPKNTEDRNASILSSLGELNPILAKLDTQIGAKMYNNYISFAKHVAKASGGFLGFFSIGPKEKALLNLDTLIPIVHEEEPVSEEEDE